MAIVVTMMEMVKMMRRMRRMRRMVIMCEDRIERSPRMNLDVWYD